MAGEQYCLNQGKNTLTETISLNHLLQRTNTDE